MTSYYKNAPRPGHQRKLSSDSVGDGLVLVSPVPPLHSLLHQADRIYIFINAFCIGFFFRASVASVMGTLFCSLLLTACFQIRMRWIQCW